MECINHITLNSGNIRKTYSEEIDKELFFIINRIYTESFNKDGAVLLNKYKLKSTAVNGHGLISTIFDLNGMPILTTAVVNEQGSEMWEILHTSTSLPLQTKVNEPPELPYVADRIEPGVALNMSAMKWTGDFSKCLAWIHLSPKSIVGIKNTDK